jgi:hypothetical protein
MRANGNVIAKLYNKAAPIRRLGRDNTQADRLGNEALKPQAAELPRRLADDAGRFFISAQQRFAAAFPFVEADAVEMNLSGGRKSKQRWRTDMRTLLFSKLAIGVASCALLLSACGSDGGGLSLGAGTGGGSGVSSTGGGSSGSTNGNGDNGSGSGSTGGPTQPGGGGSSGGGAGGGSTGGGSNNGGGATQASNNPLGDGIVTITADGTTVSSPPLSGNPVTKGLLSVANNALNPIVTTGNALLPSASLGAPLPLQAKASNTAINGSASEPLGLGLLAPTSASGTVASLNLLSGGKTAAVSILPNGTSGAVNAVTGSLTTLSGPLAPTLAPAVSTVTAATAPVTSAVDPVLAKVTGSVGATTSIVDPTVSTVMAATAPVTNAAQPVISTLETATAPVTSAVTPVLSTVASPALSVAQPALSTATSAVESADTATGVTAPVTSAVSSLLGTTGSVAAVTAGSTNLTTGSNPLLGVSTGASTQNQGSVASVGLLSGGQPVTVKLGNTSLLGSGSLLSGLTSK